MKTILLLIIITTSVFTADQIGPDDQETEVSKTEGESVTLNCFYETSSEYVGLSWYRQYPNRALQYLLYRGARKYSGSNTADSRFQSTTTSSSTDLTVTVRLADTALYYCALRVG
uniref:Ig-like domain-containing protein n=1 Tax=Astyanax mexicanus TaxID=7994 RepID=A0A3B1J2E6_ASTMX